MSQLVALHRLKCLAIATTLALWPGFGIRAALAQDEPAAAPQAPLAVIAAASVERLLTDVDYMFDVAGRPELSDVVTAFLANANDLQGVDRNKPLGVMLFLGPGLAPRPVPVAFVPVQNLDQLIQTVSVGSTRVEKLDGADDRYELIGPRRTFQVHLQHGYAFVGEDAAVLDRTLPDPVEATRAQTGRYDLSARLDLDAVPSGMKNLFLDFLRASAEAELQQRDNEPEGAYRVRKANGLSNLQLIERVLLQGKDLTIGLDTSAQRKSAVLEAAVNATPDSAFAKHLQDIAARRSRFTALLDGSAPLTFSMSWMLDQNGKTVVGELLNAGEAALGRQLAGEAVVEETPSEPKPPTAATRLFAPLKATVENGHLDFVAQFRGEAAGRFSLIGGLRIVNGDAFASSLQEVINRLQQSPGLEAVQLNAGQHQGVAFHRLKGDKEADPGEQRLYGGKPALHVGAGSQTLWFAVGGDDAFPALKQLMDQAEAAPAEPAARNSDAPFQLIVNSSRWLDMIGRPGNGPRPGQELAREAFTPGADRLRVDFRPTETGARLRLQFDEGFVRFLGLSIARRYDRSRL